MVTPAVGEVVLVRFPFSDLTQSKLRPAACLADAGRGDWVLCQMTSNAYGDSRAIRVDDPDFVTGGLKVASHARPAKLFTAHERIPNGAEPTIATERRIGAVLMATRFGRRRLNCVVTSWKQNGD